MDRLTERDQGDNGVCSSQYHRLCGPSCHECSHRRNIIDLLADYEDTGLTVKEVLALKEEIDLQRNSVQVLSLWLTKIQKRLEKLTPGGSEFYNDPDKCLDWLQMQNDSYKEQFKRRRKAEQELEQVKAELGATVECLSTSCRFLEITEDGMGCCVLKKSGCDECESIWRRKEED